MDEELPSLICPRADRWMDFASAMASLKDFAVIEAKREWSREYERLRKQAQREGKRPARDDAPERSLKRA